MKLVAITAVGLCLAGGAWIYAAGSSSPKEDRMSSTLRTDDHTRMSDEQIKAGGYQKATFAAGCFWGVEHTFRQTDGVVSTTVGYTGGSTEQPSYEQVCAKGTGHAEAVEVVYDPKVTSYEKLLAVFWDAHNPTTRNRQGLDVGSQYRSAIFYQNEEQKAAAEASRKKLDESGKYKRPIVTEITAGGAFWPAEDYHQQYYEKTGRAGCSVSH